MRSATPFALAMALTTLAPLSSAQTQPSSGTIAFDPNYGTADAKTLPLGGLDVVYLEKGRGEPVVFYYPGNDYRIWQWQIDAASPRYRAVAIAFAPPETPLPPGDLAGTEGLAAALQALELGPVHMVSHSISAWQAMALAAERPELFRTLVLEEPAVDLRGVVPECTLTGVSEAERASCLFSSLVHGPGWFEALPPELRAYYAAFQVGTPQPDASGASVDPADFEFPSICEEAGRLSMPILFIRGAETPAHFQAKLDEHERCLREHETVTIPGASHSVHVDRPAEYNRAVLEFLARHDTP